MRTAKTRVGLAADGTTLVDADTPEAASLFAAEGQSRHPNELANIKNVDKFFAPAAESKILTAKERVYLSADGKNLLGEGEKGAASLYAAAGATRGADELASLGNAKRFFGPAQAKSAQPATQTHVAPVSTTRVVAPATPAKAPAPKVRKRK